MRPPRGRASTASACQAAWRLLRPRPVDGTCQAPATDCRRSAAQHLAQLDQAKGGERWMPAWPRKNVAEFLRRPWLAGKSGRHVAALTFWRSATNRLRRFPLSCKARAARRPIDHHASLRPSQADFRNGLGGGFPRLSQSHLMIRFRARIRCGSKGLPPAWNRLNCFCCGAPAAVGPGRTATVREPSCSSSGTTASHGPLDNTREEEHVSTI